MLTYYCGVALSHFQSSQVDLQGKTRPFDPYKGTKGLETYFGTACQIMSYFSRILAPDEYHFSAVTEDSEEAKITFVSPLILIILPLVFPSNN